MNGITRFVNAFSFEIFFKGRRVHEIAVLKSYLKSYRPTEKPCEADRLAKADASEPSRVQLKPEGTPASAASMGMAKTMVSSAATFASNADGYQAAEPTDQMSVIIVAEDEAMPQSSTRPSA